MCVCGVVVWGLVLVVASGGAGYEETGCVGVFMSWVLGSSSSGGAVGVGVGNDCGCVSVL